MDVIKSEVLLKKVKPLENSKVWQSSALELKAFILLKDGQKNQQEKRSNLY